MQEYKLGQVEGAEKPKETAPQEETVVEEVKPTAKKKSTPKTS